jgi:calcium-dependent protein kinase
VLKGVHKKSKLERAIKIVKKSKLHYKEEKKFFQEIEILKNIDHPNILKIYGFYQDSDKFYIINELCEGGELF